MDGLETLDVLTDEERADLDRVADRCSPSAPEGVLARLAHVYVDARVAGLCREGALELFEEAVRDES